MLVNPHQMQALPGRKTAVQDAQWLADLLAQGVLQPRFIPPAAVRAVRELTRHRRTLVQARVQEGNRLQQVRQTAHSKLAAVASEVLGTSGRAMLDAVLQGQDAPQALADLARGRVRAQVPALPQALDGRLQPHQRTALQQILAHLDSLDTALAQLQRDSATSAAPFAAAVALAQTLAGGAEPAAVALIGELGADRSVFPSHRHRACWAGVCPGNKHSGAKRLNGKTTPGNPRLKALLCAVAHAIAHTCANSLSAQYHRLARRRGKGRASLAVAQSVLLILYHLLRDHRPDTDLGADSVDRLDTSRLHHRYVQRLEQLGSTVTLTPAPAA